MADTPVVKNAQWSKIEKAINSGGKEKIGAKADRASKLLAGKSLAQANGPDTYSASDIRKLANDIDNDYLGGKADNGYLPGDILNGIYSGLGGGVDWLWDNTIGRALPSTADWFSGEDVGNALDIATDVGLSMLGPVGIGAVAGKNLLQNIRNYSDAFTGYNSVTGEYLTPQQQAMKLAGTTGTVALSALPFGIGKIGKAGSKVLEGANGKTFGALARDIGTVEAAPMKEAAEKVLKAKKDILDNAWLNPEQKLLPAPSNTSMLPAAGEAGKPGITSIVHVPNPVREAPYASTGLAEKLANVEQPIMYSVESPILGYNNTMRGMIGRFRNKNAKFKDVKNAAKEAKDSLVAENTSLTQRLNDAKAKLGNIEKNAEGYKEAKKLVDDLTAELTENSKAIAAIPRAGKVAKTQEGGFTNRVFGSIGGKRKNQIRSAWENWKEKGDDLALRDLVDLLDESSAKALNITDDADKAVINKILEYKGLGNLGEEAAASGTKSKNVKNIIERMQGENKNFTRGPDLAILGAGLATQAANMYGNGSDPLTAFIDNPQRFAANLVAGSLMRKPTRVLAGKRYGFAPTAQNQAAALQRMNYLNRLAQDQYTINNELSSDEIADILSGQAYAGNVEAERDNPFLYDILGQMKR